MSRARVERVRLDQLQSKRAARAGVGCACNHGGFTSEFFRAGCRDNQPAKG